MVQLAFLVPFLLCVQVHVLARPSRTVPYFPQYNPWNIGDIGIHAEESRWRPYNYPEETYPQFNKYIYSIDPSDKELKDRASIRDDIQLSLPVYEKGKEGFVPPSLSALSKVYWWEKRFNNFDIPPSEDLPYGNEDGTDNELESSIEGRLKKRDYTAAQLVNMLKALAKARRQRQIRIAGKGLRFGISR